MYVNMSSIYTDQFIEEKYLSGKKKKNIYSIFKLKNCLLGRFFFNYKNLESKKKILPVSIAKA